MKRFLLHERSPLYTPLSLYLKTPQAISTLNQSGTGKTVEVLPEDILILEAEFLPLENAIAFREKYPLNIVYYLFNHPEEESIYQSEYIIQIKQAKESGLLVIPAHYTQEQIFSALFTQNLRVKKIIAVAGSIAQAGTTTFAHNLAGEIARKTTAKVGVFGFNAFSSDRDFYAYEGKSLSELWTEIQSQKLNNLSLVKAMHPVANNHFILASPNNPLNAYRYSEEAVNHLIKVATEAFDVVILDVGTILNTALAVQGLILADTVFFVTTQQVMAQPIALETLDTIEQLLGLDRKQFLMILNKNENKAEYLKGKDIANYLGVTHLIDLKFNSNIPIQQTFKQMPNCLDVSNVSEHMIEAFALPQVSKKKWGIF